jgi:S1-C subfamily serine protease
VHGGRVSSDTLQARPGRSAGRSHDIEEALATMRPGQAVAVVLIRDQQPHTVQVSLGQLPGG